VLLLAGLMLASLNQHSTSLNYIVGQSELKVSEIAAIFLFAGFLLGLIATFLVRLQRKTRRWLNKNAEQR